MLEETYQLCERESGRVVVARLERADSVWKSLRGLLGRRGLEPETGLWLSLMPLDAVHTFGMRFSIDLLCLTAEGRVVRAVSELPPWRIVGPLFGARHALELPVGTLRTQNIRSEFSYQLVRSAGNPI